MTQALICQQAREHKLAESDPGWRDVKICRFCGRAGGRLVEHLLTNHRRAVLGLFLKHFPGRADEVNQLGSRELTIGYKREFGYGKTDSLIPEVVRQLLSEASKRRIDRLRRQRRRTDKLPKMATRKAALTEGRRAKAEYGVSIATRERKSIKSTGRALPKLWVKDSSGAIITDWTLAQLRLRGGTTDDIAKRVGMEFGSVAARLRRVGFPGSGRFYYRGEAVAVEHLNNHFADLMFVRAYREVVFRADLISRNGSGTVIGCGDLASVLKVEPRFIYNRTRTSCKNPIPNQKSGKVLHFDLASVLQWVRNGRHQRGPGCHPFATRPVEEELAQRIGVCRSYLYQIMNKRYRRRGATPLSRRLSVGLLRSIDVLRGQWETLGSTASGGRPKALLPGEEKELPQKYQALEADLRLLFQWSKKQDQKITANLVGAWMCEKWRLKKLRVVLFWPTIHSDLPKMCERVKSRTHGGSLGSAERAKEIICREYHLSRRQLSRLIVTSPQTE